MSGNGNAPKARAVGINHVALEVGDIRAAIEFYGGICDFSLRFEHETAAEIDLGDQFIALAKREPDGRYSARHFGLVVDDPQLVRAALETNGVEILPGRGLNFRDPWGNLVQIVTYGNIQFMKTPGVLAAMDLGELGKTDAATNEIEERGFTPK